VIYLFDIDGTIADITHRLHFLQKTSNDAVADWRGFFKACPDDKPIAEVIEVLQSLTSYSNSLIGVTGRSDEIREETETWLYRNNILFNNLLMRKAGDHREDTIVKSEMLDQILKDRKIEEIGGVFEDRQQVVDMFRARGLRVFQVAPGNF
jgi:hypothetical protein